MTFKDPCTHPRERLAKNLKVELLCTESIIGMNGALVEVRVREMPRTMKIDTIGTIDITDIAITTMRMVVMTLARTTRL